MGRSDVTWLFIGFVLAASAGGCFQDSKSCSPCPPGTRASNPTVVCSACVPSDGAAGAAGAPSGAAGMGGGGAGGAAGGPSGTGAAGTGDPNTPMVTMSLWEYAIGPATQLAPNMQINNYSAKPFSMHDIEIRYWYTSDIGGAAGVTQSTTFQGSIGLVGDFNMSIVPVIPARPMADSYLSLDF